MSPLSQKLSELRPFLWVKSWQNFQPIKFSNLNDFLRFRPIRSLKWSKFIFLKAYTQFQGQTTIYPRGITRTQNPGANRVKIYPKCYWKGKSGPNLTPTWISAAHRRTNLCTRNIMPQVSVVTRRLITGPGCS